MQRARIAREMLAQRQGAVQIASGGAASLGGAERALPSSAPLRWTICARQPPVGAMPATILLANAPAQEREANEAKAELEALGYAVDTAPRPQALKPKLDAASRVVLLWSPDAAKSAPLRAVARRAQAAGKLVCVRVERSPGPGFGGARIVPRPRARGWTALLEGTAMQEVVVELPRPGVPARLSALLTLVLLGVVTAAALYAVDASFAARVDSFANQVRALVGA